MLADLAVWMLAVAVLTAPLVVAEAIAARLAQRRDERGGAAR